MLKVQRVASIEHAAVSGTVDPYWDAQTNIIMLIDADGETHRGTGRGLRPFTRLYGGGPT